jgi:anaerobic ribonucleoside-triphosphate reductase
MKDTQNKLSIMVVKRNGKKVDFDGSKIAIAIKKGFENLAVLNELDEEKQVYSEKDVNKVYNGVIKRIEKEYKDSDKIKIEEIQDLIEVELKVQEYEDVYKAFSEYRERRAQSRELFFDDKRKHKFLKTIEGLGLKSANEDDTKRENANIDGDSAMGTMLQYGSTISKEFAKTYLIRKRYADAHDEGDIHIHDMDFLAMGTTTCMQIELDKLFKKGFSTGHGHLRPPKSIISYSALAAIAIQSNQNDQHGGQSVPAFDYYMAPGVLNTFKKQFKQQIYDVLDYQDLLPFINMERIARDIDKLNSIEIDIEMFEPIYKESEQMKRTFEKSYDKALQKTNRETYQAMEAFVHNLNTMHSRAGAQVPFSSINFGTDTTPEGRMVTKNYLLATEAGLGKGETPIFPVSIFKVKEGVNYNPEDINYDLFKLSCSVSAKRLFPNFSFLDAPFNLAFYKEGDVRSEVGYMGCRTRVMADVTDLNNQTTGGRGNLSFSTLNLPRLGIKYGVCQKSREKADMKGFYQELGEVLDLIRDQLLERFEVQCNKRVYNFPFLLAQGVWTDGDKLKSTDRLRKILKHGTLSIGFIGLAETLKALIGSHHGESEEAQKLGKEIISFMRKRIDGYCDELNLNFTLLATPAEGLSGRFVNIDKAIYGKIKGVTDKNYYTNSFHIPVYFHIGIKEKITIEAPYHAYTNAGHISYIELDGDAVQNLDAFESIIRLMKESGVGYGAINHPVDRDPVCGFVGVIDDVCPGCGRKEFDSVPLETVKTLNME